MQRVSIIAPREPFYYKACLRDTLWRNEAPIVSLNQHFVHKNMLDEDRKHLSDCHRAWMTEGVLYAAYLDTGFPPEKVLSTMAVHGSAFSFRAFLGNWDIPSYDLELVYDANDKLYYCACYDVNIYKHGTTATEAVDEVKHEYKLLYT